LWLATAGAARALTLEDRVGDLAPGLDADVVVLDLAATPLLAERTNRVEDVSDMLAVLATLGDDRCVRATYAAGMPVWSRQESPGEAQ
jgi:guanine deaminase